MRNETNDQHQNLINNLKLFRRCKDITQAQISQKLNIHRSTYAYYETGKTLPDIFVLKKIADYYGVKIDDLLEPHNDLIEVCYFYSL